MILLYYFLAGLVLDILITVGWYALEKKWVVLSSLSAIAQTLLGYTVFYNLFPEGGMSLELVTFAVGGGVGVAGVVLYKKYWSRASNIIKYPIRFIDWCMTKRGIPEWCSMQPFDELISDLKQSGQLKFLGWWKGKNRK